MEPIEQLSTILPAASEVVDRIRPDQLHAPTPCATFDVRDVLDHMIVLGGSFAYLFRGEEPPTTQAPADDGTVPAAEFRKVMDDLLDAVRAPGALDRDVPSPMGVLPGDTFARLVAFDGLIHGWDLARATAQPYSPPAAVVAAVDDFIRVALTDDLRDGDTFAAATEPPAGATPLEQLVAFSGRTV